MKVKISYEGLDKIFQEKKREGISANKICATLDIEPSALSAARNNRRSLSKQNLFKIAIYLNCNISELISATQVDD